MAKQRLTHIDNAKAIGMMLIIASHVWTTETLSSSTAFKVWDAVINSFYVPLFFILSGVFESESNDWIKYRKRLATLVRYIIVFALFGFLWVGLIKGTWCFQSCLKGTVIWFLFTLFWITAIFGVVKRVKYSKIIVVLLALPGIWLSHNGHSYFFVGQALLCIPFYAMGFFLKDYIKSLKFSYLKLGGVFVAYCISMLFFQAPQNVAVNMVTQPYITFYLSAILGSAVVIEISKLINWKPLAWYGRNSIVPMCVQMVFIWIIGKRCIACDLSIFYIEAIIVIILCGLCIPLFRNKLYNIF